MTASDDVFDIKKIRRLVQMMKEHDLSEIDLEQGEQRIRLRRGGEVVLQKGSSASPASAPSPDTGGAKDPNIAVVCSPILGTFYLASGTDSAPFVKIGDHVGPESTVCIIEAMKVFNEIPAEVSGKVIAILVENGDPVEFGQPLFKVDVSA
jgi:acetyl-CoA carboxylase biotin carboxyl carrier protein